MLKGEANDFVTVFLEGLMISCFNPNKQRLETAILRDSEHDFSIRIVKYEDNVKTDDNEYGNITFDNVSFSIEGIGSPEVIGFRKFEAGGFDRANEKANDPNDFRWLTDLEGGEFHNTKLKATGESTSMHNTPLTPLYIKNAEFYVGGLTNYDYNKLSIDEKGEITDREFFGKVGYVLVARINADSVSLNFEGSEIYPRHLQREKGINYKIFFTNIKEGGDDMSELPVYYRVVKSVDNNKFEIEKIEEVVQMYHGKVNCTKVFLGETETIDGLS